MQNTHLEVSQEMAELLDIPTLDSIFRANRHLGEIAQASDADLAGLAMKIDNYYRVRHMLHHWQILAIKLHINGQHATTCRLVGQVMDTSENWITSDVQGIDLVRGIVLTRNSVYGVCGEKCEERDLDLHYICAALNSWGLGQLFGVPPIHF